MSLRKANGLHLHEVLCRADDKTFGWATLADARQEAVMHLSCIETSRESMMAHQGAAVQLPAMRYKASRSITAALWLLQSLGHWLRSHSSSS